MTDSLDKWAAPAAVLHCSNVAGLHETSEYYKSRGSG